MTSSKFRSSWFHGIKVVSVNKCVSQKKMPAVTKKTKNGVSDWKQLRAFEHV
jgi:hypothetical protein